MNRTTPPSPDSPEAGDVDTESMYGAAPDGSTGATDASDTADGPASSNDSTPAENPAPAENSADPDEVEELGAEDDLVPGSTGALPEG